jgi:hypothetical protein
MSYPQRLIGALLVLAGLCFDNQSLAEVTHLPTSEEERAEMLRTSFLVASGVFIGRLADVDSTGDWTRLRFSVDEAFTFGLSSFVEVVSFAPPRPDSEIVGRGQSSVVFLRNVPEAGVEEHGIEGPFSGRIVDGEVLSKVSFPGGRGLANVRAVLESLQETTSIGGMAEQSDVVVIGEVIELGPHLDAARELSRRTVVMRVVEALKSNLSAGSEIAFRSIAVADDHRGSHLWVHYELGERAAVFLENGPEGLQLLSGFGTAAKLRQAETGEFRRERYDYRRHERRTYMAIPAETLASKVLEAVSH